MLKENIDKYLCYLEEGKHDKGKNSMGKKRMIGLIMLKKMKISIWQKLHKIK